MLVVVVGAAVVVVVVDPNKPGPKLADFATCGSVLVVNPIKEVEAGIVEVVAPVKPCVAVDPVPKPLVKLNDVPNPGPVLLPAAPVVVVVVPVPKLNGLLV